MLNDRKIEFDIMKGILIILVVIGHTSLFSPFFIRVIFWFHMPAFFMINGYLTSNWVSLQDSKKLIQKILKYVVPYFTYCILLYILMGDDPVWKFLLLMLLAGRLNVTSFTYPFGFICSLLVATICYGSIKKYYL